MYPQLDLARAWMAEAERRAERHHRVRAARAVARARRRAAVGAALRQRSGTPGRAIDSGGTYDAAVNATPMPTNTAPLSRSTRR